MPVEGEMLEVNNEVVEDPSKINDDAENTWIIKIRVTDASQIESLMSREDYDKFLEE